MQKNVAHIKTTIIFASSNKTKMIVELKTLKEMKTLEINIHPELQNVTIGVNNATLFQDCLKNGQYKNFLINVAQKWHVINYRIGESNMEAYAAVKERYLSDEMLEWRNNNIFLAMTTEMQMSYAADEAKFEAVRQLFASGIDPKKTIIFCRWIITQEMCKKAFPDCAVLSMQKESLGLNLQQYKTTIYFDKVWDYALYVQSTRRTYRTGQEEDCDYYDLTGNVGLEMLIDKNISKKISMSEYLKKISIEDLKKEL